MNHFKYSIKETAFNSILKGTKKVEGRLYKNSFKYINVGDTITFYNKDKTVDTIVTKLKTYDNFGSMLLCVGIKNTIPHVKSFTQAISVYNSLYTKEDLDKYPALAIHLEKKI